MNRDSTHTASKNDPYWPDLNARRAAIDKTLGALQRIGRVPPTAMLASPDNVTDAVRTSVLLSAIVPELSAQAQSFRSELLALRQIRGEIIRRRAPPRQCCRPAET